MKKCRERRNWSKEDKDNILYRIEQGEPISRVAKEFRLAPNQIYLWKKDRAKTLIEVTSEGNNTIPTENPIVERKPVVPFKTAVGQFNEIVVLKQYIVKLERLIAKRVIESEIQRFDLE